MLVPGVSGGSMAIIIGIYDKLIASVSSFMKHKRTSALFLGLFSLGGVLGMLLFAKPLSGLIERYPAPMLYFFIGAVAGGVPLIYKQANIRAFSWKVPVYIAAGILIVLLLSVFQPSQENTQLETGILSSLLLVLSGFIAAVALVLPGISVSYLLLLMGLYDETMQAIENFYLPFLIPLLIGLFLGIIITTKLLEQVMENHPQPTYLIILGFILASILNIFPGIPSMSELPICLLTLAAGFFAIRLLSLKESKKTKAHTEMKNN